MNVLAIRGKHRPAADKSSDYRERRLKNRKPERNYWDGDRDDGGRLLCTVQRHRTQHEADEKASAIAEKNGCWVEVVTQETQNCAR